MFTVILMTMTVYACIQHKLIYRLRETVLTVVDVLWMHVMPG